jgi:hypothetical protein
MKRFRQALGVGDPTQCVRVVAIKPRAYWPRAEGTPHSHYPKVKKRFGHDTRLPFPSDLASQNGGVRIQRCRCRALDGLTRDEKKDRRRMLLGATYE